MPGDGRVAYATRGVHQMGSDKLVLAQDEMPPETHNTELHFHSAREEAWLVRRVPVPCRRRRVAGGSVALIQPIGSLE